MRNRKSILVAFFSITVIGYLFFNFLNVRWMDSHPSSQELELLETRNRFEKLLNEEGFVKPADLRDYTDLLSKSFREASLLEGYEHLSDDEKEAAALTRILRNSGITSSLSEHEQRANVFEKLVSYKERSKNNRLTK